MSQTQTTIKNVSLDKQSISFFGDNNKVKTKNTYKVHSVSDTKKVSIKQMSKETLSEILEEIEQKKKSLSSDEQGDLLIARGELVKGHLDKVRKYLWEQVKSLPGGIIAGIITKYL